MTGRVRVPSCCAAALWLPALLLFGCKLDDRRFADLGAGAGGSTMFGPGAGDDRPDASGGLVEGPQLVVARTELDLGAAVTGFAALGRVVVENGGNAPVGKPVFTLAEGSDPDFSIAQDQCGHALAGGERCDVRVQVVPSKPGPLRGTLQIYSDPGGMASVALSGEGLSPGDIVLAPVPGGVADYGDVPLGMGVEAVFRVDNPVATATGVLQASLASEAFVLVPPVDGECAFGTTSLAGGQACDVRVAFQPSVRGPAEGTLSVSSPNLGAASLALRGQGRAPGALAVSTETVDFAGIVLGKGGSAQLSVLNDGDEPVTIASVTVDGDAADAFPIAATECAEGTMLEGGEQAKPCAIDLAFRPKAAGAATATLHVASTTGVEVAVALAGQGLLPGALSIAPSGDLAVGADGAVDLGDIVIGEGRVQAFQVSNGGAEPSGVITLAASSGVTLVPASGEGDCQSGVTTLVDGQSCTVSVQLEPSKRAPLSGSLTVTSELVGSASLALRAQGISKGVLELGAEDVNFGRVVLGAKAPASLAIRNGGDQPLEPPSVAVGRATSGSAAAFTFENGCTEALAAGAECSIDLTFEPMAAGAHSATLDVGAAADGNSSVLLLGDALEPGSLALAAAPGSSAAFGDVARGATVEKSFTVSNGGGVASGRLTITTTSNQFVPDQGNCNPPGSSGLVDGSSCTFAVRFTPTSANPVTATLNIDSPGAGAASLALSGRGRAPPLLDGSSEFNFEVVIVGERSDPPRPWAVTNRGDLPTAALSTMGATSEFLVNNDGCAGQVLPAGGTCNMQVSFAPQQAGARSGSISVREAGASGSSVRLGVSGVGQALPAVGQACQGGRCAAGASCEIHSNGQTQVCCGTDCRDGQRCDVDQGFLACTLPVAQPGGACGATATCPDGYTCQPGTPTGRCCEDCFGACRVCGPSGSCDPLPDGQLGGCDGNQDCRGGECTNILSPASLSVDPLVLEFGPIALGAETMQQAFTVTNQGEQSTGVLSVATDLPAFILTGDCPGSVLTPGASCTLTVSYRPTGLGFDGGQVSVGDGSLSIGMSVQGTGVCPDGEFATGGPDICAALRGDGEACSSPAECTSGRCAGYFADVDGDGSGGDQEPEQRFCGFGPPFGFSNDNFDCCDLLDPGADPNTTTTPDVVHTGNFSSDSRPARACVRPFDFNCDGNEVPDPLPAPFDFCDEAAGCLVSPGARRNLGPGDPGCGEPYELVLCAVDDTGFCGEIGALPAVQNCL